MARKSRKQNKMLKPHLPDTYFIQTAAYIRLSVEDRDRKGDSIETQKRIILNFIDDNSDFKLYDTYIDEGVSGRTFERPNFQRMLKDAEAGKVKCIIVKDLSRLGRNVIDTGFYAERIFPSLGVRLISINDNYDSAANNDSITLPITNLMNEAYAFDIGRKTKSQARQAMKDGIYVGGAPPYGYIRAKDNHRKLVVDEVAANTIRKIFDWAASGTSAHKIAKTLNMENISAPSVHKKCTKSKSGLWYASTVKRILENEIYLGNLVQGKTKSIEHKRQDAPLGEWIRIDNAHEAIITSELFKAVQSKKSNSTKKVETNVTTSRTPNIFKGKIYCVHCGRRMERKKNHEKYMFRCTSNLKAPGSCEGCNISEDNVRQAITDQLIQYRDVLTAQFKSLAAEEDVLQELQWLRMELSHKQDVSRTLYENLTMGVIEEKDYRELKESFQVEVDSLKQRATALEQRLNEEKIEKNRIQESVHLLERFASSKILTEEIVEQFVKKIITSRNVNVYIQF